MNNTDLNKKEIELFINPIINKDFKIDVNIFHLDGSQLREYQGDRIYSKSLLFILVLNGNTLININFKEYHIESQNIILLSQGHFFEVHHFSDDFQCIMFYIGKEYIDEMYSAEMLYMRTKYNVKMYNLPQLYLSGNELEILQKRLHLIDNEIKNTSHAYQKELILYAIRIFFLELSSIIEKNESSNKRTLTRDEIYFQEFLDLLVDNYQKEHLVDFYANALHITSHYLTLIIKRLTGQTVSDIIFQLIFSEAKFLLQNPNIAIQQIAEQLYFSDQSAFGKFFKRRSGISPKIYRQTTLRNRVR